MNLCDDRDNACDDSQGFHFFLEIREILENEIHFFQSRKLEEFDENTRMKGNQVV